MSESNAIIYRPGGPMRKKTETIEVCSEHHVHTNITVPAMPGQEVLYQVADLFKVFGDPTRIRILYTLSGGELCVCDIAAVLNMTQSAISHQLRILKEKRLVKFRREGKTIFYSLADSHVETILRQGLDHITE